MDDCIVLSSDEEDQGVKKIKKPCAKNASDAKKTDSTKSVKVTEEIKEEAKAGTSGSSEKGINGYNDPEKAFEEFVAVCRRDEDPDMEKIVEKMKKYHKNASCEYTESREFITFLSLKSSDVLRDPRNIYVFIKEVVDELRQRRSKRIDDDSGPVVKKQKTDPDADEAYKAHKLKLLCKVMEKLKKKIQRLEEQEVDFEDDNDSAYIQLERYKERLVKVYEKICELSGEQQIGQVHRRKISFTGTSSTEINKCIEKFINKTGQFPDYHDIFALVKTVESEKNKTPEQIRQIAIEAFVKAGEQLQLHRRYESWKALSAFLNDESDPADMNPELQEQLKKNYEEYANRIPEVIDQFAEKQDAGKMEPEEVPDDVADQSEGHDDDEEDEDEVAEGDEEHQEKQEDDDDDNDDDDDDEENETEFVEKVLSGEMSDDDSDEDEEEDRAKNKISLENQKLLDYNDEYECSGSVSPPILGEDLNGRLMTYGGEDDDASEPSNAVTVIDVENESPKTASKPSNAVTVIDIESESPKAAKSSYDSTEPIVIE